MTKRMERVIDALKSLPDEQQDSFADFVLHELETDARWVQTTQKHADTLDKLISEVLESDRRGETEVLDPDQL